jgi:hypothetical protein
VLNPRKSAEPRQTKASWFSYLGSVTKKENMNSISASHLVHEQEKQMDYKNRVIDPYATEPAPPVQQSLVERIAMLENRMQLVDEWGLTVEDKLKSLHNDILDLRTRIGQ